jgi:ribosome-binding protein aMBF1 (putative translation factor)
MARRKRSTKGDYRRFGLATNLKAGRKALEPEIRAEIGKRVRKYRTDVGMSISELSVKLGYHPSGGAVSDLESGRTGPHILTVYKIAEVLHVSVWDLLP